MKRSHYACDQCRRSKRACDAPPLLGPGASRRRPITTGEPLGPASERDHEACSYCTKTKKTCTMNWAWAQLQPASPSSNANSAVYSYKTDRDLNTATKRQRPDPLAPHLTTDFMSSPTRIHGTEQPVQDPNRLKQKPRLPSLYTVTHSSTATVTSSHSAGPGLEISQTQSNARRSSSSTNLPDHYLSSHLPPNESPMSIQSQVNHWSTLQQSVTKDSHSQGSISRSTIGNTDDEDKAIRAKRRRTSSTWSDRRQPSLSSFSVDQTMMTRSNNEYISTNLLQIYHDVLEHNLSCWLTEVTCPYRAPGYVTGGIHAPTEWGSSWSNRIYRRTINLDHAIQTAKLTKLTRAEDQAAAKAFQLSIMAFATQWAQGSRRQQQRYSGDDNGVPDDILNDVTEEFDRNIQRNIWEQAKRALQEVADVESYRVATAELIFGLTQKPWTRDDEPMRTKSNPNTLTNAQARVDMTALNSELGDIISRDGLPVFIRESCPQNARSEIPNNDSLSMMNPEDRGTVGLLYWLAVMLDTVSSSMSERPVVVADADSQHDDADEDLDATTNGRWNVPLFIQDSLEQPHMYHTIHWPCSYESAAEAVTKSAPVKVLLFRHISYLQNILRRGGRGVKVEETIKTTTSLYRYWNMTHGAFFKELLYDYETVPGRLQSWFVCISGHWNLGALNARRPYRIRGRE
ncbi:Ff.00g128040.m01.CDS01 [Fusarium sp. VM40]|nr:Ff.00g128040.m01.CDS01 [Fusarium sp. VM40]